MDLQSCDAMKKHSRVPATLVTPQFVSPDGQFLDQSAADKLVLSLNDVDNTISINVCGDLAA